MTRLRLSERTPLTPSGSAVLSAGTATGVTGWAFGWIELMAMSVASILMVLAAVPFVVRRQRLEVERVLQPQRVTVGAPVVAILRLRNPTRTPIGSSFVEERVAGVPTRIDVTGLGPNNTSETLIKLPTGVRGIVEVGPTLMAKGDPLGLLRRDLRQTEVDRLWVHPRVVPVKVLAAGRAKDLEGPTSDASPAGDVAFHAVRDYAMGDDPRHVHWLSTARTGSLMVKHYVDNRIPHLTIVLDPSLGLSKVPDRAILDLAVEAAASLTISTLRAQLPVALYSGGEALIGRSRSASITETLDRLTTVEHCPGGDLQTEVRQTISNEPDTSCLVVVTGPRSARDLLPISEFISPTIVRACTDQDSFDPIGVPGVTILDVRSLEQFHSGWNGEFG